MSDSLLTTLLIENFLNAHPQIKASLLKENNEVGLHKALSPDSTDENEALEPHLHKALTSKEKILSPEQTRSLNNPKKPNSLLSKAAKYYKFIGIPLTLAALLHNADISKDKNEPINPTPVVEEIIASELDNESKAELTKEIQLANSDKDEFGPQVIYKAKRSADFDKMVSDFIISNEGFTSKPHSDVKQVSIGHGTSVSDGTTQIPKNWKQTLYKRYDVPEEKQKLDPKDGISRDTAKHIFDIKYNKNKRILDDIKYIHVFPEHIQTAIFDLAFNMGPYFFEKFANFNEQLKLAAEELKGGMITPENIDNANTFLYAAKTELLGNYDEMGRYEGPTKYRKDLKNRSDKIANILNAGVSLDDFEVQVAEVPSASYSLPSPEPDLSSYSQLENKKYSLKNIFFS